MGARTLNDAMIFGKDLLWQIRKYNLYGSVESFMPPYAWKVSQAIYPRLGLCLLLKTYQWPIKRLI